MFEDSSLPCLVFKEVELVELFHAKVCMSGMAVKIATGFKIPLLHFLIPFAGCRFVLPSGAVAPITVCEI